MDVVFTFLAHAFAVGEVKEGTELLMLHMPSYFVDASRTLNFRSNVFPV